MNPSIEVRGISQSILHSVNDCPYKARCGGCVDSGGEYLDESIRKFEMVRKLLPSGIKAHPMVLCEKPFYYRNKVHSGFDILSSGSVVCGPYEQGSHRIIKTDDCKIENSKASKIIRDCADLAGKFGVKIYNEKKGTGQLRRILVRTADGTGQIMVVLVMGTDYLKSKKAFINSLLRKHPEITTVITNINTRSDSMILGRESRIEYGKGFITDTLLGMKFRIGPDTFYQINRAQAEKLYSTAIRMGRIGPEDSILDAYCGIGTTTLSFAKIASNVTGVEVNRHSVQEAKKNASSNGFTNASFVCADATDYMMDLAAEGRHFDVVVLDPPRSGTTLKFIKACKEMAPDRIVYISCDPRTLADDIKRFSKNGYDAKEFTVVDMFPWTESVETIVVLSKGIDISAGKVQVEFSVEDMDLSAAHGNASYNKIKKHVYEKTGLQVSNLNIAQVKRKYGIIERENYNLPKSENSKQPNCTPEKEKAIVAALQYFKMIG
ncbi:MAG: 23S rRNA (uracil(1939)-C(5))-methyltransferase RlmD [Clostridiales bacterium]|nr:23S rRNA (uracil(1939)-C(5))-methyltransferase RlmD [Clostridiales bacterium]